MKSTSLRWVARLIFSGLVLAPTVATAGPPYVTDDPEPTDLGKWEIYAFAAGTRLSRGTEAEGGLDINHGAAKDLQLTVVLPFGYEHEEGKARAGFSDVELGAKYMFVHQQDDGWRPDVSFYPTITLPTARHGFGRGRVGAFLPLFAQKDFGTWSMFGGGGYEINPGHDNRDSWSIGYAVTREVNDRLSLGAEAYHNTREEADGQAATGLGLGGSYRFAEHWSVLGSGGPIVQHRRANGRYAFYLGLAFAN